MAQRAWPFRPFPRTLMLGLAMVFLASASALADPPRAARLVSADALVYVEARQPGGLIDRVSDARLQKVLAEAPGYAEALKNGEFGKFRGVVEFVAGTLETTWDKGLRDLTGGGFVLAFEGKEKPERLFAVITPDDPDFLKRAHAKLLDLARNDAKEKGNPDPVKEG